MKNTLIKGAFALLMALALTGCGSAFHNGTEMTISSVKITGLPANPYAPGQNMVFSYNMGSKWVHDDATLFDGGTYTASVAADGSLTYNFSPALVITTPTLTFLMIDPAKGWNTYQIDKKHSGKKGGDGSVENLWSAGLTLTGKVSGDDVTWTLE